MSIIETIRQRHELADDVQVKVKGLHATVKADGDASHKFTAIITSDAIDRDSEVLLPQGLDSSEFDRSGSIFWNHNYDRPVGIAGKLSRHDRHVEGQATFLKRPEDHQGEWFPDFARAYVGQSAELGKAVGVSVGFIPIDGRAATKKDKEMFGEGVERVFSKWKLLEWSIAPVQSNPEAVVTAVRKGLMTADQAKQLGVDVEDEKQTQAPRPARRKTVLVICQPAAKKIKRAKSRPVNVDELVRREIAKIKGQLYVS